MNGSQGIVVDFLTIPEALARAVAIAGIPKDDKRYKGSDLETMIEISKKLKLPLSVEEDAIQGDGGARARFNMREKWPLVRFTEERSLLCVPERFTNVGYTGMVEVTRHQVPLILAWAISIHKSQGQTLARVKIDMKNIFENGQGKCNNRRTTRSGRSIAQSSLRRSFKGNFHGFFGALEHGPIPVS